MKTCLYSSQDVYFTFIPDIIKLKALVLQNIRQLEYKDINIPLKGNDEVLLKVSYCAICKTDAKMWYKGQRDLILPRILGHELSGINSETGKKFVIWPGIACNKCSYCLAGYTNLCDFIKIIGFNKDGGFAEYVSVPQDSLIPLPDNIPEDIACFAELLGCAINALDQAHVATNENILIYGAGPAGLMLALAARLRGVNTFIFDNNPDKFQLSFTFRKDNNISDVLNCPDIKFNTVINANPGIDSFTSGLQQLARAGKYILFSGFTNDNNTIPVNILNDIHYKQLTITGAYGCTKEQMIRALAIIQKYQETIRSVVQNIITLQEVEATLPLILDGKVLTHIIKL